MDDRLRRQAGERTTGVTLKRDHVAGGLLAAAGLFVYAVSDDLPWGSMAMPGAGMLPKLVIGLIVGLAVALMVRAGDSPPLAEVAWKDLPHAVRVTAVAAVGIGLYTWAGFLVTMSLLLFGLTFVVERRPILNAALFSVGVTGVAYILFSTLLKSPLPRGILGF
jgi:hypothetical protein